MRYKTYDAVSPLVCLSKFTVRVARVCRHMSELPISEQSAKLLVDVLLRIDKNYALVSDDRTARSVTGRDGVYTARIC